MLDFLRQRAGSWLVKTLLGAIIVVFVFWGVGSFRTRRANLLATVNGKTITITQYQQLYAQRLQQLEQMFRGQLNEEMLKQLNLSRQVFEELVKKTILDLEAKKMGIMVTPDEVRLAISRIHAFQENGHFSPRRYRIVLRQLRILPKDFEEEVRSQLLEAKIRHLLTTPIIVTTEEAKDRFIFENESLKIGYIKLPISECEKDIKVEEKDLISYFKSNREKYRTPLKLKLTYYLLKFATIKKGIKISDEEIKQYYEVHKESDFFRPEARKVRHILIRVKSSQDEAKARERAEKILALIKKPEDLAKLAKKYSDDPHTKEEGGELGFVTKDELFESLKDPVFNAKEGEIVGPIRSPLGYHILLVEKIRPQGYIPLTEVREKIIKHLKEEKLKELAWEKANKIYDQIILVGGLEKWAKKQKIALKETPLFSIASPPLELIDAPEVIEEAKKLDEGELGSPIETPKGILIFKVSKKDQPHIPDFKDVENKVKKDYVVQKARTICEKRARDLLARLRSASDEKEVLKEAKIDLQESALFKRKQALSKSGLPRPVAIACQTLGRKGQWVDEPILASGAFYLAKVIDLRPANLDEFHKKERSLKMQLVREKRRQAFMAWYKHLREVAEIKFYHQLPNQ